MTSFYDDIELTEQEIKDALLEAKKKKYFKEKHREYWKTLECKEGKTEQTAMQLES